jgi:hypothetical protein
VRLKTLAAQTTSIVRWAYEWSSSRAVEVCGLS